MSTDPTLPPPPEPPRAPEPPSSGPSGQDGPGGDTGDTGTKPSVWEYGRHRTDIGQLVMGLAFLSFVGCWALVQTDVVTGDDTRWLLPIPWVLAGVVGLVVSAVGSLRRRG